ncbi:SMP-30/gluconolactonase/LRE family protein [Microbulbifer taiwanensis]|uniref:SMP-30/gluconolactonase/LRE family protein n=1 Tax=Microbulbifer taiwanensis TaxID=986746 RepID=A0ABW1YN43_9GAMM|nr:SMP-30/gluconolactonase/LRE family protein [Microbulbifer taiwanensis]
MQFELMDSIPVHNLLGEGIVWNHRSGCAWWTDIHGCRIYRYRLADRSLATWPTPERLGCFGFVDGDEQIVAAFASGIALFRPQTGERQWLWRPEEGGTGNRFNDGRVDRQGRFWAGTMVEDESRSTRPAGLYCLHSRACRLRELRISNGLCWSPDSSRMYHADSARRQISVYDFDPDTGRVANGRPFARTADSACPDGATVDAQGYLWSAHWGGSRIVRYAPDGSEDTLLHLPVSQPSCVAFGGRDFNLLFVTSAREGLSTQQLRSQPHSGNLLIYRTPYRGLPESFATPLG